jgi:hypothetical protein
MPSRENNIGIVNFDKRDETWMTGGLWLGLGMVMGLGHIRAPLTA